MTASETEAHSTKDVEVRGEIQPMRSARLYAGRYEVIGTSGNVEVVRRGRYWWLVLDGHANIGPFPTKRAALQFAQASPEL